MPLPGELGLARLEDGNGPSEVSRSMDAGDGALAEATSPMDEEVEPRASSLVESLRAFGYSPAAALADLVDNSITARASNVWIRFFWAGRDSFITVLDDGAGMREPILREAMRPGTTSPLDDRDRSDL